MKASKKAGKVGVKKRDTLEQLDALFGGGTRVTRDGIEKGKKEKRKERRGQRGTARLEDVRVVSPAERTSQKQEKGGKRNGAKEWEGAGSTPEGVKHCGQYAGRQSE